MSYLTLNIISVAILLVVMVVVLFSKKSETATVKESDDKQKNTDACFGPEKTEAFFVIK